MPMNKDRLYVGLYACGGGDRMPGGEDSDNGNVEGVRYDAKERMTKSSKTKWYFEERRGGVDGNGMLLIRLIVAKVPQPSELIHILRQVPVKQGLPGWNCVAWVKEALEKIEAHGKVLGTHRAEWLDVMDTALWYVEKKKPEHRFDGQGDYDINNVPTYDLMESKETMA
ncbi:hypothetical protein OIDMADRAFT_44786 [Oidiodendron maius Zn]|uniref:Uncharacterized protein n=1 Tax=Oidiodendron maius (strain Zn) TaxID=913774 RepID=A0A0C3H0F4_OIDMZ|nr:hypothetical protein OIDMADRAFT_44786 [Oidiodendron maius Zn]